MGPVGGELVGIESATPIEGYVWGCNDVDCIWTLPALERRFACCTVSDAKVAPAESSDRRSLGFAAALAGGELESLRTASPSMQCLWFGCTAVGDVV